MIGRAGQIRIIDASSVSPWGHINVDEIVLSWEIRGGIHPERQEPGAWQDEYPVLSRQWIVLGGKRDAFLGVAPLGLNMASSFIYNSPYDSAAEQGSSSPGRRTTGHGKVLVLGHDPERTERPMKDDDVAFCTLYIPSTLTNADPDKATMSNFLPVLAFRDILNPDPRISPHSAPHPRRTTSRRKTARRAPGPRTYSPVLKGMHQPRETLPMPT